MEEMKSDNTNGDKFKTKVLGQNERKLGTKVQGQVRDKVRMVIDE